MRRTAAGRQTPSRPAAGAPRDQRSEGIATGPDAHRRDTPWERGERVLHLAGTALTLVTQAATAVAAVQAVRRGRPTRCR